MEVLTDPSAHPSLGHTDGAEGTQELIFQSHLTPPLPSLNQLAQTDSGSGRQRYLSLSGKQTTHYGTRGLPSAALVSTQVPLGDKWNTGLNGVFQTH